MRVVDHDAGDRTTSEAQAYAMFFALVANDRPRFDGLLGWTERNLASGDLQLNLPAWLWGRGADNPVGRARSEFSVRRRRVDGVCAARSRPGLERVALCLTLGRAMASRIATNETAELPNFGVVLLPGAKGFRQGEVYRLNTSYLPLQLFVRLAQLDPGGPWRQIADRIPALVQHSAPNGFVTDWLEFSERDGFKAVRRRQLRCDPRVPVGGHARPGNARP